MPCVGICNSKNRDVNGIKAPTIPAIVKHKTIIPRHENIGFETRDNTKILITKTITAHMLGIAAEFLITLVSGTFTPKTLGAITEAASTDKAIAKPLGIAKRTTRFKNPGI